MPENTPALRGLLIFIPHCSRQTVAGSATLNRGSFTPYTPSGHFPPVPLYPSGIPFRDKLLRDPSAPIGEGLGVGEMTTFKWGVTRSRAPAKIRFSANTLSPRVFEEPGGCVLRAAPLEGIRPRKSVQPSMASFVYFVIPRDLCAKVLSVKN
jgi:hypothetical protein